MDKPSQQQKKTGADVEAIARKLQHDPKLLKLMTDLMEQQGAQEAAQGAVDLFNKAYKAARDAPYGKGFNALHSVVVDEGPRLLSELTQGPAQAHIDEIEKDTPAQKKTTNPPEASTED